VTLLSGAGLLIRTMERLRSVDLGFRADHVLAMRLPVSKGQASNRVRTAAYFYDVVEHLKALPEVRDVSLGEQLPDSAESLPSGGRGQQDFEIAGRAEKIRARYNIVSPGYFSTLEIPLLRGRYLSEKDRNRVVISESMARSLSADPIGQQLNLRGE